VASTADNTVFAVPHAGVASSFVTKGTPVFTSSRLRGPLALVFAPNGNLLTANGDAVNGDPAQPSELVEFTPSGKFVSQVSVDHGTRRRIWTGGCRFRRHDTIRGRRRCDQHGQDLASAELNRSLCRPGGSYGGLLSPP